MTTEIGQKIKHQLNLEFIRRNFPAYCEYVHGMPLYNHQRMWVQELQRKGSKTLIVAPPLSRKSTTLRMFVEWTIGNDCNTTLLYIMNTASQAERQIMAIAETIEKNDRYHEVFPWVKPDKNKGWTKEVLFLKREKASRPDPTVYGTGIDGPYQGSHVDMIIVDDPTDQKDVFSDAIMNQQRQRLRGVLIDRLQPGGSIFAILTRWGEADLVRTFQEMGFTIIENPVEGHYPWGRLLCPEIFPDDYLLEIRQNKVSGDMYQLTYMCNPQASVGAKFRREWWRRYSQLPEGLSRPIHSWDIATGKKDIGDYSAFGSWAVGQDGYYLLDAGRFHLDMDSLVRKMQLLFDAQKPQWILVEEAGVSIPIIQYLQRRTAMPIMPVKPGTRDKVARADSIQAYVEGGRVWLPASAPWVESFIDECAAFPGGQHDDQVDQMSQALIYLTKTGATRSGALVAMPWR